jgi:hypothetical protein
MLVLQMNVVSNRTHVVEKLQIGHPATMCRHLSLADNLVSDQFNGVSEEVPQDVASSFDHDVAQPLVPDRKSTIVG